MENAAKIKRRRDLMQLRDLKEKMRTVLFQIASKSDPRGSSVSLRPTSIYYFASCFAVVDSIGSQEPFQRIP
jgi:hypothetical protein